MVYNFKKANWGGLSSTLQHAPWDIVIDDSRIDSSLSNWVDLFLCAVDEHVPKISMKGKNARPWIDKELIRTLREKDKMRKSAKESAQQKGFNNYNSVRKEAKLMLDFGVLSKLTLNRHHFHNS